MHARTTAFACPGRYLKELDPQLHTSGPCLSNASYTSVTHDDSLWTNVQISGGRTDDLVRVFIHVQVRVLKDVNFTRLVFFQAGSETYNYYALFDEFVIGSGGTNRANPRVCVCVCVYNE